MKRLDILIAAHECSPNQGSECSEGWNIVTRLSNYHNITVLCAKGSQFRPNSYENALEQYFAVNPKIDNIQFIMVEQPKSTLILAMINKFIAGNTSSIGNPLLYYLGYKLWQRRAYKVAKQLVSERKFDIIHHLTSITFREPGFLWKLPIPFVWGPTGGVPTFQIGFYKSLSLKVFFSELIRASFDLFQFHTSVRIMRALRKGSIIYTFSKNDQILFQKKSGNMPKILLDAASELQNLTEIDVKEPSEVLSVLWCGQLIRRKALEIILFSIANNDQLKARVKLKVIGGGPLLDYYKRLSKNLNIEKNIDWKGQVDHDMVFKIMRESDIFVHSSYREATSNVIPEALSNGLPVICHDISGMSVAINEKCGIKVPLVSIKVSIEGFQKALLKLLNNPNELTSLRFGAKERAKELSWDSMTKTIAIDYLKIREDYESTTNK